MSTFSKSDAVKRMLSAASEVRKNELGTPNVLEQIAVMQAEGLSMLQATMETHGSTEVATEWMTGGQCAKYFGISRNSFFNWLAPLVAAGKVRTMTPQGLHGGQSWTRYSVKDLERELVDKA